MSNELTISTQLAFSKGNNSIGRKGSVDLELDVTGTDFIHASQAAQGAAAVLDEGNITAIGYCWVKNRDATNYVVLGYDPGAGMIDMIKLKPGEETIFRAINPHVHIRADTAPCIVEYVMVED